MALIERVGPLCLKTGALGVLTLLLLWPLARVRSRIEERRALEPNSRRSSALRDTGYSTRTITRC
jgi:hypothetical protein